MDMDYTYTTQDNGNKSPISKEIIPTRYNSVSTTKMTEPDDVGNNSATQIKLTSSNNTDEEQENS